MGKKKKANAGDCPGSINHLLPAEAMSQMIEKNEAKNEDMTEKTKWSQEWYYYVNTQTHLQTLKKHTEQIPTQGLSRVFYLVLKICRATVFL